MLSVSKIRTTNQSAHTYYGADDYYSQNNNYSDQSDSNTNQELNLNHNNQLSQTISTQVPSLWYGKLTKDFNLEGSVDGKISDNLVNGILPNGITMQGKLDVNQKEVHDSGRDLTFSAPKSVSILSEILGVDLLRKSHNLAVEKTLSHIEENYSFTRIKQNGQTSKQLTKNMLFATYVHNTSRELDPQLHTHCMAFNLTKRNDGNYRTLLFDGIFDDYKHLGLIYRSNLAFEIQKLGFIIEVTDNLQGFFEIKGLPKEIIDVFSSRRKQIEEKINELGMNSAKAKEVVALLTRDKKVNVADHLLKENWRDSIKEVLQKLEIKLDNKEIESSKLDKIFRTELKKSWKQNIKDNFSDLMTEKLLPLLNLKSNNSSKPAYYAKESVKNAVKILNERNSVFTEKNLIDTALKNGLGKTNFENITKEIETLKQKSLLLTCSKLGLDNFLATKISLETELKIIEFTKESLKPENQITPIYSKDEIKELNNIKAFGNLNKNQKQACNFILNSPESIIAIQGYAGTGKTHMLETTAKILAGKNIEILGFAPTGTAVKELENVGIKSRTLQWFLGNYDKVINGRITIERRDSMKQEFKNKIIVVDEASLISSKQMENLLIIKEKLDLKLVLLGDTKQENAVEAGHPFYQMQKHHLKTITMDEIIRQKNQKLKTSIYDTIKASDPDNINHGYIRKAFANIDNIIEVKLDNKQTTLIPDLKPTNPTRLNRSTSNDLEKTKQKIELIDKIARTTADQYTNLSKEQRDNTLILIPSNETRAKINYYIRQNLKESGELSKNTESRNILINQSLEEGQKQNINAYQKNDIIKFNKSYKTNNIIQDQYYQVIAKDVKRGTIYLTDQVTKKEIVWNPAKIAGTRKGIVEIYKQEVREFAVGEKINFTRGFNTKNIANSEIAEIKNFTEKSIILQINNKELEINKSDPILNHIDYGYGYTVYRAQGKTTDNVIAVLESYRPNLTTQKSFYVEISRARHDVTLIVDNKEKIIDKLEKTTGEKISILDLLNSSKLKQSNKDNKYTNKDFSNARNKDHTQYLITQFSNHEIKDHFLTAIRSETKITHNDIDNAIDQAFNNIGQKIRFGSKKENEICWHGEAGYITNYKSGEILKWGIGNIKSDDKSKFKEISKEELEMKQKQATKLKQHAEKQRMIEKQEIAKKAERYFNSYSDNNRLNAKNNRYLIAKNIIEAKNISGIKFTTENQIVIPLTDTANKIHSMQYIKQDGSKKFLKGGEKQGHFFLITKNNSMVQEKDMYLAEGFATAASIHQAIGKPVAVCFDAGNIEHVLKNLKSAHPDKQFIIAADNDMWKETNTGKDKALIAASKYGAKVILPQFKYEHKDHLPTDFNDLHKLAGIDEVRRQISNGHQIEHFPVSNSTNSHINNQIHKEVEFGL